MGQRLGSVQAIYVENPCWKRCRTLCGTIYSLYIDKEAWLREELRGGSRLDLSEEEDETLSENVHVHCTYQKRIGKSLLRRATK